MRYTRREAGQSGNFSSAARHGLTDMEDFFSWFARQPGHAASDWLLLGKGPSLEKLGALGSGFRTFGLNHVMRSHPLTVAHAIDLEVIEQCGPAILSNAGVLAMPWVPHVRYRPLSLSRAVSFRASLHDLDWHAGENYILRTLAREGRLLWYNLCTAPRWRVRPGSPIVPVTSFSANAALNLLAMAGVRRVRSLGIDGGRGYSAAFTDLRSQTMLVAGQPSYDSQFQGFAKTIMDKSIDFAPLDVETPVQVFVGAEPEQLLAIKVLEHSIRKHCSMSVRVTPLFQALEERKLGVPIPRDPGQRARTPFTFQRFCIPQLKNFKGRAIYLDSDMIVFRDIRQLWNWPFEGANVLSVKESAGTGRRPQFSVMVLDCTKLDWHADDIIRGLDEQRWTYEQLVFEMTPVAKPKAVLPPEWNELERYEAKTTALTHFTDMDTQPWLVTDNVHGRIWCELLFEAVRTGKIARGDVDRDIERGWVRPSLAHQLDHGIVDPFLLPDRVKRNDALNFIPPHRIRSVAKWPTGYGRVPSVWQRLARHSYARVRDIWFRSRGNIALGILKNRIAGLF